MNLTYHQHLRHPAFLMMRFLLGGIFIYAAVIKLAAPQDYADSIAAYQILPFSAINLLAIGLPVFEFVCGLLLITGFFLRPGILGVLVMLVLFVAALSQGLIRGLSLDCGCFGTHSWLDSSPTMALIRDGILLTMTICLYRHCLGSQQD